MKIKYKNWYIHLIYEGATTDVFVTTKKDITNQSSFAVTFLNQIYNDNTLIANAKEYIDTNL